MLPSIPYPRLSFPSTPPPPILIKNKIYPATFRVAAGTAVNLADWPTAVKPTYSSKRAYKKLLESQVYTLSYLQRLHYASGRHALLLIFQAMDAAGKFSVTSSLTASPYIAYPAAPITAHVKPTIAYVRSSIGSYYSGLAMLW